MCSLNGAGSDGAGTAARPEVQALTDGLPQGSRLRRSRNRRQHVRREQPADGGLNGAGSEGAGTEAQAGAGQQDPEPASMEPAPTEPEQQRGRYGQPVPSGLNGA